MQHERIQLIVKHLLGYLMSDPDENRNFTRPGIITVPFLALVIASGIETEGQRDDRHIDSRTEQIPEVRS